MQKRYKGICRMGFLWVCVGVWGDGPQLSNENRNTAKPWYVHPIFSTLQIQRFSPIVSNRTRIKT
jgi:hypothetical protein